MIELEKELVKLGLSEKEAKVYLASIQIGPSPVQKISQKSKVNRATTYVIIESLMEMGLMSTYEEGKKTFFVAEKPKRLVSFFETKEKELHNKLSKIKDVVPQLDTLYNDLSDKPKVKYYEGVEGLKSVQSDFADSLDIKDEMYIFLPFDDFEQSVLKKKLDAVRRRRIKKGIKVKIIYTSKEGRREEYESTGKREGQEHHFVEHKNYPFKGGMNIYGNKVFMIDYRGKLGGIVIENKTLANLMKTIFKIIWDKKDM